MERDEDALPDRDGGTPRERKARQRGRDLLDALTWDEFDRNPGISPAKARKNATARLRKETKQNPHFADERLKSEPSSRAVQRKTVNDFVELRGILLIPEVAWLFDYMCKGTGRGRPTILALVVAVFFRMSYFGRPEIASASKDFYPGSGYEWAFGKPDGPNCYTGICAALRKMLDRKKPGAAIHVNLELLDWIAARVDKKGRLFHPNAFRNCSIDGTLIEANVPQESPRGRSEREYRRHERLIAGLGRPMVKWVSHKKKPRTDAMGEPLEWPTHRKACFGYNLVIISSIDLGLPIIWTLIPASYNERDALVALIKALYRIRPEFPMEHLVGDGLFATPRDLTEWMALRYGILLVTPLQENMRTQACENPECAHGPMDYYQTREFWNVKRRIEKGLKPGQLPPPGKRATTPRILWTCPKGRGCRETTYPHHDWHQIHPLPHRGASQKAAVRTVLLGLRNCSESLNAQLKHNGVGADWPSRARWANDNGMRWIVSVCLMQMTARRVAHLSGTYEHAMRQAERRGLLKRAEVKALKSAPLEPQITGPARAPESWGHECDLPIDREFLLESLDEYSDEPWGRSEATQLVSV